LFLSVRYDPFVFSVVRFEFENVCNGLVIASASASVGDSVGDSDSDSDSAAMISVVI
jgi:hypothetical protein